MSAHARRDAGLPRHLRQGRLLLLAGFDKDGEGVKDPSAHLACYRIEARTDRLLAGRITHPPNRRLLQRLRTERPALFTCLRRPDVEATNWQAEQAIRPAVVTRKVCGGNRTPRGAATQSIVASVPRTCAHQQRDPLDLLVTLQRSSHPIVADLNLPGPAPPI